jgi:hypothetical protein
MSSETTPILSGTIPAFEIFMSQWEQLGQKYPRLSPWIDEGLLWAEKYYRRMDFSKAYAIAMCRCFIVLPKIGLNHFLPVINPTIRMTWIRTHWEQHYIEDAETKIKATVSHSIHSTIISNS